MSKSTNIFRAQEALGKELVCNPSIRIKFSKKLGLYVKTWFEIERNDQMVLQFKQKNAFHKDRNADPKFWTPKPFGNLETA